MPRHLEPFDYRERNYKHANIRYDIDQTGEGQVGLNVLAVIRGKSRRPGCMARIALEDVDKGINDGIDSEYPNQNPAEGPGEFIGKYPEIEKQDRNFGPCNSPYI